MASKSEVSFVVIGHFHIFTLVFPMPMKLQILVIGLQSLDHLLVKFLELEMVW